jgi:hypothetical protein
MSTWSQACEKFVWRYKIAVDKYYASYIVKIKKTFRALSTVILSLKHYVSETGVCLRR